jgi:hypothetical protein
MDLGINGLKGQEREIGQELMKLTPEARSRVIEAVSHDTWGYRECRLQTYQPEILYSTGKVGISTFFFAQAAGQYHSELGRMLDWADTNMGMAGCLGMPLAFTRKELRIYPKKDHPAFEKLVAASHLKDWKGQSHTLLRGGDLAFRPIPIPQHKYNRERSFKLVEYLNQRELPCWAFDVPKHYSATEVLMVTLEQDLPVPSGGWLEEHTKRAEEVRAAYEACRDLELICVMLGALDAPVYDRE